jgi:voltage-gated potassium channel
MSSRPKPREGLVGGVIITPQIIEGAMHSHAQRNDFFISQRPQGGVRLTSGAAEKVNRGFGRNRYAMKRLKKRIFEILELAQVGDLTSRVVDIFIIGLILINVLAVILQSVEALNLRYHRLFWRFEVFSIIVFTIEYILRLWSCTASGNYTGAIAGRIRYALAPLALVDLFAILPFYIPVVIPFDLRFIRVVRLFRLFRLFKLSRYTTADRLILNVLKDKKEELIISLIVITILLIFASTLMYLIENTAQPEVFSSIPASLWWGVATLTTVGYGDLYPITPLGKFLGAIISILGIGMFALPAGIFASGFAQEIQKRRKKEITCPKCGTTIKETVE